MKTVSRGALQARNEIAARGLEALLIAQSASFEADINIAAIGQVMLTVQLRYMNSLSTFSANFNFNDSSALKAMGQVIAQKLLNL